MGIPFTWTAPDGWAEIPSTSQFRVATFEVKSGQEKTICTIIPLRGDAGGLEANLQRWFQQLHPDTVDITVPVQKLLRDKILFQTVGGLEVTMVDFTPLAETPNENSFLVAVIKTGKYSIFVKMMGPRDLLIRNSDKFKSLAQSFRIRGSQT
jgi:hypothetical protein